jgi:protein subunit release factor B
VFFLLRVLPHVWLLAASTPDLRSLHRLKRMILTSPHMQANESRKIWLAHVRTSVVAIVRSTKHAPGRGQRMHGAWAPGGQPTNHAASDCRITWMQLKLIYDQAQAREQERVERKNQITSKDQAQETRRPDEPLHSFITRRPAVYRA